MHFFGQFKDHNSERKHRNRINDPIFYLLFLLQMFATFIFIFENGQISFSCGPLFGLFRSVKYLNFEQKLPSRTAYQIFLESRHREVTKNPYYVLSPKGSQKKVSYNGLIPVYRGVYIHYFKISPPTFCCPHFSENYLNPQVRINKIVNKHTADQRLSYFYRLLRALSLHSLSRIFS